MFQRSERIFMEHFYLYSRREGKLTCDINFAVHFSLLFFCAYLGRIFPPRLNKFDRSYLGRSKVFIGRDNEIFLCIYSSIGPD